MRRPPRSTRTDTLFPDTSLFRSRHDPLCQGIGGGKILTREERRIHAHMFGFGRTGAVQAAHFADHLPGQEGEDLVQPRRGALAFVYASNPPILDQRLPHGITREGETPDTLPPCPHTPTTA